MLKGKTALITGSSRGIGQATALKFAKNGAFVGINYLTSEKKANGTLEKIKKNGGDGMLLKGDISKPNEVKKMIKKLIDKREKIDILVNNAGIYPRGKFKDIRPERWEKVLSINLTSYYYLCKEALEHMQKDSRIIFISSQLAFRGTPHGADYATSKAGMLGFMRSLALELGSRNILVNAVAPGTIDTDLLIGYSKERKKERGKKIPLGRIGVPEDIANACLFLASDLSSYITGETINVNGGLYIH